jgi:hypothetical protein
LNLAIKISWKLHIILPVNPPIIETPLVTLQTKLSNYSSSALAQVSERSIIIGKKIIVGIVGFSSAIYFYMNISSSSLAQINEAKRLARESVSYLPDTKVSAEPAEASTKSAAEHKNLLQDLTGDSDSSSDNDSNQQESLQVVDLDNIDKGKTLDHPITSTVNDDNNI